MVSATPSHERRSPVIQLVSSLASRIVNAIVDRIPAVSQEATWTWWNRP
jgi:hypothetical protein